MRNGSITVIWPPFAVTSLLISLLVACSKHRLLLFKRDVCVIQGACPVRLSPLSLAYLACSPAKSRKDIDTRAPVAARRKHCDITGLSATRAGFHRASYGICAECVCVCVCLNRRRCENRKQRLFIYSQHVTINYLVYVCARIIAELARIASRQHFPFQSSEATAIAD